jgi:phytoene dehydrogenase-like protein
VEPDPVEQVAFPDGEQFTMWLDPERTIEEVARFSRQDAAAYRRLLADYDEVKQIFSRSQFTPVGFGPSLEAMLAEHPRGRIWARRRQLSAVEVVRHEFTSRHIQAFLLWMAFQVFQPVDMPGSGVLPYQQTFGRQQRSWSIPVGGSGQLTAALTGYLESHGSQVLCNRRVSRLLLEDGRCVGVETSDGEQYRASVAVVSTIHATHLRDMAPAAAWPEEFHYGIDTYDVGVPGFATYYCTTAAPEFASPHGPRSAVSAGLAGWPEDMIQMGADLRAGRFLADPAWVLVATPTLADPSRAPAGQHTVKILTPQSYQLPAGQSWEDVKEEHARRVLAAVRRHAPNLTGEVILGHLTKSPADIEQLNPHMIHGAFHHRRARPERGHRPAHRPRPRPGRGDGGGSGHCPCLTRPCGYRSRRRARERAGRGARPAGWTPSRPMPRLARHESGTAQRTSGPAAAVRARARARPRVRDHLGAPGTQRGQLRPAGGHHLPGTAPAGGRRAAAQLLGGRRRAAAPRVRADRPGRRGAGGPADRVAAVRPRRARRAGVVRVSQRGAALPGLRSGEGTTREGGAARRPGGEREDAA